MIDTLNDRFPQFRNSPFLARVLAGMQPYRAGYELQLRCVPDHGNIDVAASATFEGRVTVPNAAYLYAISGSSSAAAGFDINVRNAGNQQDLSGRRVFFPNVTGQNAPGAAPHSPLFYLPRPLLYLEPAQLLVQIWNRATTTNTMQIVLWFFAPEVSRNDS